MRLVGNDPNLQGGIRVKFFLDTADLAEIEEAASWGALAGVTTSPSLYAKIGGKLRRLPQPHEAHLRHRRPRLPVSAESVAMTRTHRGRRPQAGRDRAEHRREGPHHGRGPGSHHTLAAEGIPVNMTLCFSVPQALLGRPRRRPLHQPVHRPLRRHLRRRSGAGGKHRHGHQQLRLHGQHRQRRAGRESSPHPCAAPTT